MTYERPTWPAEFADRYRREGLWRGETLDGLLRTWAARYAGRTALVHGDRRFTYEELDRRADRTAAGFRRHGIEPGDRVVLQLPNVAEFAVVFFGLLRAGARPVFSLASHRANEIRHLCELSGAAGYVIPGQHRGFDHTALALRMVEELPTLRRVFTLDGEVPEGAEGTVVPLAAVDAEPLAEPVANDPSDTAFFLLSGGTTALPKLIPRTHDDYAYQTRTAAEVNGLTGDDVYLAALPVEFNFTWGCPGVLGTLQAGGTAVLAEDPTADDCFALIAAERVTFTSLVPSVAQMWLEAAEWLEPDLATLRTVQIGGARLQPELARRIEPAFGARLQQVFGMAEGLLSVTRADDAPETVWTTQGTPLSPADEIRIVDEHGNDVPPGGTGELLTRGPYTLRGYYRADEHNARAFTADGFYRSGDLARITEDGRLVIEGRIKDVVIRGGDKVSAGEVEEHLLALPNVARAAVVAAPDEYLGERVHAWIVPAGEAPKLRDVKAALSASGLADYKLPDRVEAVADFPLTGLGKVDKKVLAAAAADPSAPRPWNVAPETVASETVAS
ncbi:(2,3-dihydroxybenzoyl)adenylate synthase [Streptomyces huiliensis]|uniref:(2,3-dihydroxybenzoyl)adenylate synthase n=1 Tax=Streptomyces huiliensis TaxID=2876027 RepID=UPI001CBCDFD3|nr:AMP-binding protein [Streptomyces huiliensis]MBZ4323660.1 AMP-binding protein [Streptomyces huiliensis]